MSLLKLKGYFHALRPQIIVIGLVIILQIFSRLAFIPAPNEIVTFTINLLATQGIPLIILASFIENFAGLGTYFPGSIAIVSAMTLTAGNPAQAIITYIAVVIPAIIANILSYFVGYSSRDKESVVLSTRSTKILFAWYGATYWHPQLAAISAMASGGEGIKFWRYFTHFLPVSLTWSVFWALLLYNAGEAFSSPNFFVPLFYGYLIGWILWGIMKHHRILNKLKLTQIGDIPHSFT